MGAQQLLASLAVLGPMLEPLLMGVEPKAIDELKALLAGVSSPDLKVVLDAMIAALDSIAKAEIEKLKG